MRRGWCYIVGIMIAGSLNVKAQTPRTIKDTAALRSALMSMIDSAAYDGIDGSRHRPGSWVVSAFSFFKSLHNGEGIYQQISYDGVTRAFEEQEDSLLAAQLARVETPDQLRELARTMAPRNAAYDTLQKALAVSLEAGDSARARQLRISLNIYRWILHHPFPRYIVVNIAAATLRYYEADTVRLDMRVVVGKPSTRTPRFAAWCDNVVLYPYWNVPRKIAVNEFLPIFQRAPGMVDVMNMQLLDNKGKIVDPFAIQWGRWNKQTFPYAMRQSTGCDNALGVLKFNMDSPYDIYMHDTNLKAAFLLSRRYLSHGCIRLEKPFELGALLDPRLDTSLLAAGLKDQRPQTLRIEQPVPVFVIYLTADVAADSTLAFHRDIYHLL